MTPPAHTLRPSRSCIPNPNGEIPRRTHPAMNHPAITIILQQIKHYGK